MRADGSLPSYDTLFGDNDIRPADESRSVYSPAAYLADLIQLADDASTGVKASNGTPIRFAERRPDVLDVPLDGENSYTELPYLDIVNAILAEQLPKDGTKSPFEVLEGYRYPFLAPFSLGHERLRQCLRELGIDAADLYRRFQPHPDPDIVAREYLSLTAADAALVTTTLADGPELRDCYHLGTARNAFTQLSIVDDFRRATSLTGADLRELLGNDPTGTSFIHQETVVSLDADEQKLTHSGRGAIPVAWFDRVNRFVRLARRLGWSFTDLNLVLRTCCENRIDATALHRIAVVSYLHKALDLPVKTVVSLVATLDEFPQRPELRCTGDLLSSVNTDCRRRIGVAVGLADADIHLIVARYRLGSAGVFDRADTGIDELALLHRIGRLTATLGVTVTDLFGVLDALTRDPSIQRFSTFPTLIHTGIQAPKGYDTVLAGGDAASSLWLLQTLFAVTRWMQATGLSTVDLTAIIGGGPADDPADTATIDILREQFAAIEPSFELFLSDRFGDRAAQAILDVVADAAAASGGSGRLPRVEQDQMPATVLAALTELGVVASGDLLGLGLGDRLATKVFTNLMFAGYLTAGGVLDPEKVPESAEDLRLAGDFTAHRDALFQRIGEFCVDGASLTLFPSDLADLAELTELERAEVYDNLVFNGFLSVDGEIYEPDFFTDPSAVESFPVNADLGDIADDVHGVLVEQLARFTGQSPTLDAAIFDAIPLTDAERVELVQSLRFNGYLDSDSRYVNPTALLNTVEADLRVAAEFQPWRDRILDAVHADLTEARAQLYSMGPETFLNMADAVMAARAVERLADGYLRDGRLTEDTVALLADPAEMLLLDGFTDAESAAIAYQLGVIASDAAPYHIDPAALTALGFSVDERSRLVTQLVDAGHLTSTGSVPLNRIDYFAYEPNIVDFKLPGLEDFSRDIFLLLHAAATHIAAAKAELTATLEALAADQLATLVLTLRDDFGVPTETVEAICAAVAGSTGRALDRLVAPILDDPTASTDPDLRRILRRMRGFARFAGALNMDGHDVALAFADQDLIGKFAEPLALPSTVDRIDALLDSADGTIYVFHGTSVLKYSSTTHALVEERPSTLEQLSPALASLSSVDAAFTASDGAEWIIGRDGSGVTHTFVRQPGHPRWLKRVHEWGVVTNAFDDATRVEAAFVDEGGRTYLFHGDQYVRYSGDDFTHVDEGYPRQISGWWETERRTTPLPARFRRHLDAAFHGRDDTTYLFAGDKFLAVRDGAVEQPIAGVWGRISNLLAGAESIDAAYADGSSVYVFAGNQVTRYSANIEFDGVCADDGYPRRIEAQLGDVPAEFEAGVEAAFADRTAIVHLFKDGRTVALRGGQSSTAPTAQRWGRLAPSLPSGTVDAAFVGLDGATYVFSGDVYLRYSTADYSIVDVGYPRRVAGDWGGLRSVDAAYVTDDTTVLFGTAGVLFDVSIGQHATDLDETRLPESLRQRLLAHGITLADHATVTGHDPYWQVSAERGISLVLRRTGTKGERLEVSVDPGTQTRFHVRYSTRSYAAADPGYPRPLSDNFWNLPESLVGDDSAFARVDAVLTGRDNRTYLFAGEQFVVYDNKRRWWSEPRTLREHWDSLPFNRVDAAFVGADGRTYLFCGDRYVRYTTSDYTRVDDRYPASITPFWGNVVNNIARTGRVDAALVLDNADGTCFTYLFSGDQFVRYTRVAGETGESPYFDNDADPGLVDIGYPRKLSALSQEPRLGNLRAKLERVSAAFADRDSVYLFSGKACHVVSSTVYRRYADLAADSVGGALVQDGAVCVEHPDGWHRYSALEGNSVRREPVRPRLLRTVPAQWRTGLDAVLAGTDGNTYLFAGTNCFNVDVAREFPLAEEWGRPWNTIDHDDAVDAAFVGADGRTYVFRGDQFVVYRGDAYLDAEVDGLPRAVAEHWGGLERVTLAYVRDGVTYLFEPPDSDGQMRYVAYSGIDYSDPDDGYPRYADASFWGVPADLAPEGFTQPDAVLYSGTSMLLVIGGQYLQYNDATRTWSHTRPLERIWRGIGAVDGLTTAFTGRDGATYFFRSTKDGGEFVRHDGRVTVERGPIRGRWARTRNNFLARAGEDIIDAAVVQRGVTYLFSGDQYVRYSGPDYRFVDAGYPKPIVGNIRSEEAFENLAAAVEDDMAERFAGGSRAMVDAAVATDRTAYLFVGRTCHAVSREVTAQRDIAMLGRVRNAVADRGRVDAVLARGDQTFVFSGDQYVRYTGMDYSRADDTYPRTIASSLAGELYIEALPEQFQDGIDAALQTRDGRTYLFAGQWSMRIEHGTATVEPIRGLWGVVHNEFRTRQGLDAAFVTDTGELYAFAGGQYARYRAGDLAKVEDGYPRRLRDNWGDLPGAYEQGIDGAFRFRGRTYFSRADEYVRYSDDRHRAVDRTYPQPFRHRWFDAADYRLSDLRTISRFVTLARVHRDADGGLASVLLPGSRRVADPYALLAERFGWDVEQLRWCRRHSGLFTGASAGGYDGDDADSLELEFLLELVDLFEFTRRLGAGPAWVFTEIWLRLYRQNPDLHGAADVLYQLLTANTDAQRWPVLARTLHDELNLRKRDVLVATVLAGGGGPQDLFERYLIDVEMGARGNTSKVREAIAAAQLFLHRYLLNLELPGGKEETRQQVKAWWRWMRNYRVWEANRKVFLYPENYLRPELRLGKTPAFRTLESDLLQGEITPTSVERAYKKYLDEYTEVSRLTIAGGYVYAKDQLPDGPRRLVLFGRTRTDPRRYYHRRAEFSSREKLSAAWEPWQPVEVQIDADQVHPVHAFGRVFVFWAVSEAVPEEDPSSTTLVAHSSGDQQRVSNRAKSQRVRISYSFQNLTQDWVPAQALGTGFHEAGTISDITLLVLPRMKTPEQMSIVVSCAYTVTVPPVDPNAAGDAGKPTVRRGAALFELNPELYADNLLDGVAAADGVSLDPTAPPVPDGTTPVLSPLDPRLTLLAVMTDLQAAHARAATTERVSQIFLDPVQPTDVVRFDAPNGAEFWFSVDVKGGSFLCRPVTVPPLTEQWQPLLKNKDRLPESSKVDAAVELPGGNRYFFDNTAHQYTLIKRTGKPDAAVPTAPRFGLVRTVLAGEGEVDAVLLRGEHTFVFSGGKYVRFTGTPFGAIDPGYPKDIATNDEALPRWSNVDAAFTAVDGTEFFFDNDRNRFVTSNNLTAELPFREEWFAQGVPIGWSNVDAAFVTDTATFLISGDWYVRYTHPTSSGNRRRRQTTDFKTPDASYPKLLANNSEGLPRDMRIGAALWRQGTGYFFDKQQRRYCEIAPDGTRTFRPTYATSQLLRTQVVDAAWVSAGRLYLTTGSQFVRYTLEADGSVPTFVDEGYPRALPYAIDAAFTRDDRVYVFTGEKYTVLEGGAEPNDMRDLRPIAGAWGDLPRDGTPPFDAAMDSETGLFLFLGDAYRRHAKSDRVPRPYELAKLPFEIIRLTTGTASMLNHKLLSGGVPALLALSTQETDEVAVTTDPAATSGIRVRSGLVDETRLPTGSHLDFRSANGLYYAEIFFHAPWLIAQALNGAQRFEDARRWFEYVFDPTNPESYWRFLPFLNTDLEALAARMADDHTAVLNAGLPGDTLTKAVEPVRGALLTLAPVAAQNREATTEAERAALLVITDAASHATIANELAVLAARTLTPAQSEALAGLRERTLMAADLTRQFDALGDREGLLNAYRENPFDPHAIADVRPVAYRRAVVMSYIDNLLDWGDMLFRQYTSESVDEARMLYVLAFDLLGQRPERLATRLLPASDSFTELEDTEPGKLDLLGFFTSGGAMTTGLGAIHAGVANSYFHIPDNTVFAEYWDRVADRLRKIRQSLNILGISQPLPPFEPPIDPMMLVRNMAAGGDLDQLTANVPVAVPHYRFSFMHRRAVELVDKLRQLGNDLLSVLERGSAEELSLLQGRQQKEILTMTRAIKAAQIRVAEEHLNQLTESLASARHRVTHYQGLIDQGMLPLEHAQVGLMSTAAGVHFAASVLKVAAGIAYAIPQCYLGPFIVGTDQGGRQLGATLDKASEVSESLGEGFSMVGEVLGIQAQHERMAQDWELQLATAQSDVIQLGHQIVSAGQQVAIAQREADICDREIAHNESVAAFMRDKFTNVELYGWMASTLSALYFQSYNLAYEMARAAERAYHFENGVVPDEASKFIRPTYWQSRRSGLLAGDSLAVDLERLSQAQLGGGGRGLEITRQVSLRALDPVALLRLRDSGSCEFALNETLYDYDFPGHYKRQIRTVTVTFLDAQWQPLPVNATLTQLSHRTVLAAEPQAVKYLLDPQGEPPATVRNDWRPSQQIALSEPDGGRDNNGLFELRFDDDRYLPFEGTGAVSSWRLDRNGRGVPDLFDVVVTVKYTAEQGGEVFAAAVRGLLKPYPAARFFDVAQDFPQEWEEFVNSDSRRLVLPLAPELFPDLAGTVVSGIYPSYELANGAVTRLLLGGDPSMALAEGKLLPTPGLTVRSPASFTVDGPKENLLNVGLVLTYQARA